MNEETKEKLQELIDSNWELANKHVEKRRMEALEEGTSCIFPKSTELRETFLYYLAKDLENEYGLDFKGAIR